MPLSKFQYLQQLSRHRRKTTENDNSSASSSDASSTSSDESLDKSALHFFLNEVTVGGDADQSQNNNGDPPSPWKNNSGDAELPTVNPQNQNNNGDPPSPWKNSSAKRNIISDLKDDSSDIHLFLGTYGTGDWKQVKFDEIRKRYAERYNKSNFRENLKRLLLHFQNGTGDFSPEKEEKWYTSPGNVSAAYSLLFSLYMNPTYCKVLKQMTPEDVWTSHELFQRYSLEDFMIYNKNMLDLTNKKKNLAKEEEESFRRDMLKITHNEKTRRNHPFWNQHPAATLLCEDERNGTAKSMKPQDLWNSRREYKDFPLSVFRKHIYQERMKQLASPFWQHKRNKAAAKMNEAEAQHIGEEWFQNRVNLTVDEVIEQWGSANRS